MFIVLETSGTYKKKLSKITKMQVSSMSVKLFKSEKNAILYCKEKSSHVLIGGYVCFVQCEMIKECVNFY